LKILIDMNLSPEWEQVFDKNNIQAVHWTKIGAFNAPDADLMNWARDNEHIVFTHDLDFGTALALSKAEAPSVIQVRTQNVTVKHLEALVIPIFKKYSNVLNKGALIIIDEQKERVRILPL
jgi:predicted nuclease of predicted toxin-antitoxin system